MLTAVNQNTFKNLQLNEGVFIKQAYNGTTLSESDIISATRGGGTVNIVPVLRTRQIDGVHENTRGARVIDSYNVTAAFTILEMTKENLVLALLGADYNDTTKKITPRHRIKETDYKNIYWLGELSDGKMVQITFKNAINTNGLNLTVSEKNEGTLALNISANYDVSSLDTPPFEITYFDSPIQVLASPTNLALDSGTLSWLGVLNSTGYVINISKNDVALEPIDVGINEEYDISAEISGVGDYSITVIAKGDGVDYADSLPSAALQEIVD